MDESLASELDSWLKAADDRYVVVRTIKDTPGERTEVVHLRDERGLPSLGPFVRKRFDSEAGRGGAYKTLLQHQVKGRKLAHQPILYECNQIGDFLEVVMEFVPGATLREVVAAEGPGPALAARVMPALCDAASELHESFGAPIVHRDIKPSNVMVDDDRLVLIDLGIARTYRSGAGRDTVRYGTPGYAPPEQFGYGQTSVLSDVYALGMTLAFCLTGEEPTAELRDRKFQDPRIPLALQDVLVRATEFDPTRRHQSARALRSDFEHAMGVRTPKRQPTTTIRERLGIAWNVVLLVIWGIMVLSCLMAITNPNGNKNDYPLWFLVMEFIGVLFIPWTCATYVLLDKRRLRAHEPFSRFNWRIELAVCLGATFVSMLVTVLVYGIWIR